MVASGRVKNGVVVLDNGVRLPEGEEVTVMARSRGQGASPSQARAQSILAIRTVSLGPVLRPPTRDDDLLGEMLEGRP